MQGQEVVISRLRKRSVQLTREVLVELKQVMLVVERRDKIFRAFERDIFSRQKRVMVGVGAQAPKGLPLVVDIVTEYFCVFRFSPVVFTHGLFQNGFGSEIWLDRLSVYAGPAIRLIYPFWSQTGEASFKQFGPRRFGEGYVIQICYVHTDLPIPNGSYPRPFRVL